MEVLRHYRREEDDGHGEQLIPGLPDEIAEICLLRVPYPYQPLISTVASSWRNAVSAPYFSLCKTSLSLSLPYLFVLASHKRTAEIRWHALDPRSNRWFLLPPMPISPSPPHFASSAVRGKLVLFCAFGETLLYHAPSNCWSVASSMPTPRSGIIAGSLNDKIYVAGEDCRDGSSAVVECYDCTSDTWMTVAKMRRGLRHYDAAVVLGKFYVTQGWTWPYDMSPAADVYNPGLDTWQEMPVGLREGWTGLSAVVGDRLLVITEYGDCLMKAYDFFSDSWQHVEGDPFPCETVHRPFTVCATDRTVYVASRALHVAVGRVTEMDGGRLSVEWSVMEAPGAFSDFSPLTSHVLYA